tara:strand:+ start:481 stop:1257 length:777 start_codon:yes stop_codon:yes gene_type:complete
MAQTKQKLKRAIVFPDIHFPLHDEKALSCALQAIGIVKPDIYINIGDVGEWHNFSAWKYKGKKLPSLEFQLPYCDQDIDDVNEGLDRIDAELDKHNVEKRYMLQGNHEIWMDNFVEKYPYMKDYTFPKACRIKERGYKYYEYNVPLKIGKINFLHGAYATTYHAKKHLETYGANIMYGHTHDVQRHTLTKLDAGTIGAWGIGCLKDMSREKNKWLRGRLHNWNHAFSIITWFPNGNFQVEVIEIVNGRCTVWGNVVEA